MLLQYLRVSYCVFVNKPHKPSADVVDSLKRNSAREGCLRRRLERSHYQLARPLLSRLLAHLGWILYYTILYYTILCYTLLYLFRRRQAGRTVSVCPSLEPYNDPYCAVIGSAYTTHPLSLYLDHLSF